jgi:glycosyltransferase 2 family protein
VPSSRKWLLLALKLTILGLLAWGVHRTVGDALDKLRERPPRIEPLWLVLSALLYLTAMFPSVLFWQRVLSVLGQEVGLLKTARAYYIGHLGKYVPGKALVVVLRAGMVRSERVDVGVAAATVFVETLTMMASGSFIAAALVAILFHDRWLYVAGAVVCMFAAGLPTLPPVFARLVRLTRIGRGAAMAGIDLKRIDYGTLVFGWLATGVGWFITGLSLWATLRGIGETSLRPLDDLPFLTMIASISVVAGFISMIPGGLGSRDVVMLELLRLRLADPIAVASTVVLRLVWLAAELVISAALYPLRPKR